jgi:hypothetical protein
VFWCVLLLSGVVCLFVVVACLRCDCGVGVLVLCGVFVCITCLVPAGTVRLSWLNGCGGCVGLGLGWWCV